MLRFRINVNAKNREDKIPYRIAFFIVLSHTLWYNFLICAIILQSGSLVNTLKDSFSIQILCDGNQMIQLLIA